MIERSFRIRVPGSTSNIGPGFDSIGIALNLYLQLECSPANEWTFTQKDEKMSYLPKGKDNMIYQVANEVANSFGFSELPPYLVIVESEIPIARGLGSSGAITAAGVELANQVLQLDLTIKDKVRIASQLEGHPDNVAPSILGGCVVAYNQGDNLYYTGKKKMNTIDFVAIIPRFELSTKTAREALPTELPFFKSIEGSAIGNVCTAAIFQEDYALLGEVMEKEVFHQPYRKKFIPFFDEITVFMKEEGAYGTFLSGAGPTMISIFEVNKGESKLKKWREKFPNIDFRILKVEEEGLKVKVIDSVLSKRA